MYEPSLALLRSVVSPDIREASAELIKHSSTPAESYRVQLDSDSSSVPALVLVKRIRDGWPDDPRGHEREVRFYQTILPKLDINHPHIYYAGRDPGTAQHLVIMEDVSDSHRFPPADHRWSQQEIELILKAYARLHQEGQNALPDKQERGWLIDRHEQRLMDTAPELPHMFAALVSRHIWPESAGFERLLQRTLESARQLSGDPVTVLHNDVYPPNCGIPVTIPGEAVLLDWDMAGWGLAELDLAFMFLQPFGSHCNLDRQAAMDFYWHQRRRLGWTPLHKEQRALRQHYADALWALWLIPVAYRMAESPFPPGSGPRVYWEAMFEVLGQRLFELCNAT